MSSPTTPNSPPVPPCAPSSISPSQPARSQQQLADAPPPSYQSATTMSSLANHGFPPGYFLIRSVATGRAFDVEAGQKRDGTIVVLWDEKDGSLVETLRNPSCDNQVFYIDTYGALCCRDSGHAIDVEDGKLVIRHRRPVTYPYPNAYSHPLPQFSYSPNTGLITVSFSCDPSFPRTTHDENGQGSVEPWRQKSYIVAALPERKQRTFVDDASDAIVGAFANPFGFVGSLTASISGGGNQGQAGGGGGASGAAASETDYDLHDDEVVDEEHTDAQEIDDSPSQLRQVRVIAVNNLNVPLHPKTRDRRRWEMVSLRTSKAGYTRQQT